MSFPRLEPMKALVGLTLTKQIPLSKVIFLMQTVQTANFAFDHSLNYEPFVSHRVAEIHYASSSDQSRPKGSQ